MRAKAQAKHVSRSTENKAVRKRKAGKAKSEEKTFVLKKHTSKYHEHNDGLNPKTSSFAKAITTAEGRRLFLEPRHGKRVRAHVYQGFRKCDCCETQWSVLQIFHYRTTKKIDYEHNDQAK